MTTENTKVDYNLGAEVEAYLVSKGVQTPTTGLLGENAEHKIAIIEEHMKGIMEALGLDLTDDSLIDTPKRVAKMYVKELFYGLETRYFPKATTVANKMGYAGMVMEKHVAVKSACEHHFVIIDGEASVAYIPEDKVLGLSKINRIVNYFSRRPQIQERLTEQIYHALVYILGTENVAVHISAKHYCVSHRGAEDTNSATSTTRIGGKFLSDPALRAEFYSATNNKS
jgi:GTP cyclohydrolase I